ncbi:hypothetical protein TKK_0000553 [Trichogramma kaykai]
MNDKHKGIEKYLGYNSWVGLVDLAAESQRAQKVPAGLINVVGHNCKSLDLSFNELSSLGALRDFVDLQQLVLDNNCLRNIRSLPPLPNVTTLSLNNNKIIDVESALEHIARCCPKLGYLSLLGNPGYPAAPTSAAWDEADYERFRLYVIHTLPACLRFLDSRAVTPEERLRARERGHLSRTVRPSANKTFSCRSKAEEFDEIYFRVHYTPLPTQTRDAGDLRSTFGKCHYRYSGKHSEGNRYILNSDL